MNYAWKWMGALTALMMLVALVGCGGGSTGDSAGTTAQERIVYSVYGAGLFLCAADGSNPTLLTHTDDPNGGYEDDPAWSPDGRKVAFVSVETGNADIFVINADGTGKTRLTTNTARDAGPSWSPDGTKIVFYSNRGGANAIYLMNADGSNQTNIGEGSTPAWKPTGNTIAFTSARNGYDAVYTMGIDGSSTTRLIQINNGCSYPAWNPQGTKIAFTSKIAEGQDNLYVVNADGSGTPTRLTNYTVGGPDWGDAERPSWSPDGTKIVFTNDAPAGGLMVISATGGTAQMIRSEGGDPSWGRMP